MRAPPPVDMILASTTGEVLVAGRLGDFTMPAIPPVLDRVELKGMVPWVVELRSERRLDSGPCHRG